MGTGRPVMKSAQYMVYWKPLLATMGATAARTAARVYPSSLVLYTMRYCRLGCVHVRARASQQWTLNIERHKDMRNSLGFG